METPPKPRRRTIGPNDRRKAETVSRNRQILLNVLNHPEALALAALRGRGTVRLEEGVALADEFQREYTERDDATADLTAARAALAAAEKTARAQVGDLRAALRAVYGGQQEDLERLGVVRPRMAGDRDLFLAESRATLDAVRLPPYDAEAAKVGYDEAALDGVRAAVDALEPAAGGKTASGGAHVLATDERDDTYAAFMDWMKTTRRLLNLALKDRPDLVAAVGL